MKTSSQKNKDSLYDDLCRFSEQMASVSVPVDKYYYVYAAMSRGEFKRLRAELKRRNLAIKFVSERSLYVLEVS